MNLSLKNWNILWLPAPGKDGRDHFNCFECQTLYWSRKLSGQKTTSCSVSTTMRYKVTPLEWLLAKRQDIASVREDVEKKEHL